MTEWNIHPAAQSEHDELLMHFGGIDKELVTAFEWHYLQYRHTICENPLLYNIRRRAIRRANLKPRFSEYYIAYMIWREKVVILAIAHAKRRPYYWRKRIGEAKQMF
jgi:hypothetical protein